MGGGGKDGGGEGGLLGWIDMGHVVEANGIGIQNPRSFVGGGYIAVVVHNGDSEDHSPCHKDIQNANQVFVGGEDGDRDRDRGGSGGRGRGGDGDGRGVMLAKESSGKHRQKLRQFDAMGGCCMDSVEDSTDLAHTFFTLSLLAHMSDEGLKRLSNVSICFASHHVATATATDTSTAIAVLSS